MIFFTLDVSEVKQISREWDVLTFLVISTDDSSNFIKSCNFIFCNKSIDIFLNEAGIIVTFPEDTVLKDSFEEFQVIFKSNDFVVLQCSFHLIDCFLSGGGISDKLSDHWIIES